MRIGTPGFVGERLTEARAARRIASKSALARQLCINVSTVARWEDGSSTPDADALTQLANKLYVRREFFLRPIVRSSRPMFYRSLSSTLVRDLDYQHSQMAWLQEISSILQHYIDFPAIDIPDVLKGASYKQLRDADIEGIALDLRRHWQLGDGPCGDVVNLLERKGFVVSAIEMNTSKLDGLCAWADSDERPHILLATDKMSFARRQMDAAHEMAHALLHKDVTQQDLKEDLKTIEAQAFRLASAFLMPSTTYPHEVTTISLAKLESLKERWRVSIKAQIQRLSDLEIIDYNRKVELYKLYSAKGWSKCEPLDRELPISEPSFLKDSLTLIANAGVRTKSDLLAVEFTMSAGDIENIAALPAGWFNERVGHIVQLNTNSQSPNLPNLEGAAKILQFRKT